MAVKMCNFHYYYRRRRTTSERISQNEICARNNKGKDERLIESVCCCCIPVGTCNKNYFHENGKSFNKQKKFIGTPFIWYFSAVSIGVGVVIIVLIVIWIKVNGFTRCNNGQQIPKSLIVALTKILKGNRKWLPLNFNKKVLAILTYKARKNKRYIFITKGKEKEKQHKREQIDINLFRIKLEQNIVVIHSTLVYLYKMAL